MNTNSKKMNMVTVVLLALVFLFTASMANAALVSLAIDPPTVIQGNPFSIDVLGSDFTNGVSSGSVAVNWDPTIISFNSVLPGTGLIEFGQNAPGSGILNYSAGTFGGVGVGGAPFTFAFLDFTALASPGTDVGVALGNLGPWFDAQFPAVEVTDVIYQGATVTVTNPVPIPGAAWLLGSGLLGLVGLKRRRKS